MKKYEDIIWSYHPDKKGVWEILEVFIDNNRHYRAKIKAEYATHIVFINSLKNQKNFSVKTAINKEEYATNLLKEIHPNLDIFIEKYNGYLSEVIIKCPQHGEKTTNYNSVKSGVGCSKCSNEERNKKLFLSVEDKIDIGKKLTNNLYSYNIDSINEGIIEVTCPTHGKFNQHINSIWKGRGCFSCSIDEKAVKNRKGFSSVLKRAKEVHGEKYSYEEESFIACNKKMKIFCNIHGAFWQKPHNHISSKQGCPKCGAISRKASWLGFKNVSFEELSEVPCSIYILKFKSEEEVFLKVGISCTNLDNRVDRMRYFYDIEIEKVYNCNLYEGCETEDFIEEVYGSLKYKPLKKFGGSTECFLFTEEIMENISKSIEKKLNAR